MTQDSRGKKPREIETLAHASEGESGVGEEILLLAVIVEPSMEASVTIRFETLI